MEGYLQRACEEIDAAIFSGDTLYIRETKENLKTYITRWTRAILEHEKQQAEEALSALAEKTP